MTGWPDSTAQDSEVFDFLAQFLADRDQGVVRPLADYVARFPGHEAAIRAEAARVEREEQETKATALPRRFGPYNILGRLGSGGQGTVLLAEDTRLHRRVALKMLAPHLDFVSTERLQRFRREVEIVSQLDHPGICSVFEADTIDNVPYLAMRFVEGETLAAYLRGRRARGELPRSRAELHRVVLWIETAARALHEAHEAGVVHRDIKPGNLMLTPQDQPVLLDFGLARHAPQDGEPPSEASITQTGDVLGTLPYMAPELFTRQAPSADRRVDVYALGVTLYECLTSQLPFQAESQTALWRAIELSEPDDPRGHNAAIPRELAAVVLTALAKSPAHRYATALELADDLARVRARQPIKARRLPVHVRALRFVERHPTLSLGVLALLVVLVVLVVSLQRVSRNERTASALNQALRAAVSDEGAAAALADLVAAAGSAPDPSLSSAILQVLDGCHLAYQVRRAPLPAHTEAAPALDAQRRFLALGDLDGNVTLYDAATGVRRTSRRVHRAAVTAVVFDGDGSTLLTASLDGSVRACTVPALTETAALEDARPVHGLSFAPDGRLLAVGGLGFLRLLHAGTWKEAAAIDLSAQQVASRLLFSPAGDRLLVLGREASEDPDAFDRARVIRVPDGHTLHELALGDQEILWAVWHPTRPALALAQNGGRVEVLEAEGWTTTFAVDAGQEVHWCGFDPSGDLLLVPADPGTQLWRWSDPTPRLDRLLVHPLRRTVGAAAWSDDRRMLAAVHRDGTITVYAVDGWRRVRTFKQRMVNVRFLYWLTEHGMLLTADMDKVSGWHAGLRPHAPELWGHTEGVSSVAFSPQGRHVLTASLDGTARLWALDRSDPIAVLRHGEPLRRARFSADGRRVVTVAENSELRVWDSATRACTAMLSGHTRSAADAWFLAGDTRVVSIGEDGQAIVWDLATARPVHAMSLSAAPLRCAAFHPREPWIAVGTADRQVGVWNLETGQLVRQLRAADGEADWRINPLNQVRGLCFDASGDRLLASLVNNHVVLWRTAGDWKGTTTGAMSRLGGPARFDAKRDRFVVADFSFGHLSILDGQTLMPLLVEDHGPHANRIAALAIADGGGLALSAGNDGQLWVWDLVGKEAVLGMRYECAILDAAFSPDRRWIVTGAADGAVKLWPLDPVAVAKEYLARRARSESD